MYLSSRSIKMTFKGGEDFFFFFSKVELAVTTDGKTIVCYHPSVDIPYEHTRVCEIFPRSIPSLHLVFQIYPWELWMSYDRGLWNCAQCSNWIELSLFPKHNSSMKLVGSGLRKIHDFIWIHCHQMWVAIGLDSIKRTFGRFREGKKAISSY